MKQSTKHNRTYEAKCPWAKVYKSISNRCSLKKQYGKNGIKNFLNVALVKLLWERDGASRMKRPTIDRIDTYGHYSFDNCRFIEWEENNARPKARFAFKNPRGVCVDKENGGWRVQLHKNRKAVWGGRFKKIEDAIKARDLLAEKLFNNNKGGKSE